MGRLASLFSPFWCLDAKGGEVALFRLLPGFAWVVAQALVSICILLLVSTFIIFGFIRVGTLLAWL